MLEHNSNLAEGGLARALDDLFNAFQELICIARRIQC